MKKQLLSMAAAATMMLTAATTASAQTLVDMQLADDGLYYPVYDDETVGEQGYKVMKTYNFSFQDAFSSNINLSAVTAAFPSGFTGTDTSNPTARYLVVKPGNNNAVNIYDDFQIKNAKSKSLYYFENLGIQPDKATTFSYTGDKADECIFDLVYKQGDKDDPIPVEALSEIADGHFYKVGAASTLQARDDLRLYTGARIFIPGVAGDEAYEPTIKLTAINMAERTYTISFTDGETLHYTAPGQETQIANASPVTLTITESGDLTAYTTMGTATSETVTVSVECVVLPLATPTVTVKSLSTQGGTLLYPAYTFASNNTAKEFSPVVKTFSGQFLPDNGDLQTITAVTEYQTTTTGLLTIHADANDGYGDSETLTIEVKRYKADRTLDLTKDIDTSDTDKFSSASSWGWLLMAEGTEFFTVKADDALADLGINVNSYGNRVQYAKGYGIGAGSYSPAVTVNEAAEGEIGEFVYYVKPAATTDPETGETIEPTEFTEIADYAAYGTDLHIAMRRISSSCLHQINIYAPTTEDDTTTGLSEIENGKLKIDNYVYDLQGRKVNVQSLKGLYIVNGKKVIK